MKKVLNNIKQNIWGFLFGIVLTTVVGVSASSIINSRDVAYNNGQTEIESTNVQDAIDEIYQHTSEGGNCPSGYNCINNYKLKLTLGNNISRIHYSVDGGNNYSTVTESTIIYLENGVNIRAYADGVGTKEAEYDSETNYWSATINKKDVSYSPVGKDYDYVVSDIGTCNVSQSCNKKVCSGVRTAVAQAASCTGNYVEYGQTDISTGVQYGCAYDQNILYWYIYSCNLNSTKTGCVRGSLISSPVFGTSGCQCWYPSLGLKSNGGCVFNPEVPGESSDCSCTCSRIEK